VASVTPDFRALPDARRIATKQEARMRTPTLAGLALATLVAGAAWAEAPYPASTLITGIDWDTSSYRSAGRGGDIWAPTSGADGNVYAAWGDGAVGCRRKVSYGVAALPPAPAAAPATTGCGPEGEGHGKIISLLDVHGTLYAVMLVRERAWPGSPTEIWRSDDHGRTWRQPGWSFTGSNLRPQSFVNFGPGYAGARDGYVYLTAVRGTGRPDRFFLVRAPMSSLGLRGAYQYLAGTNGRGSPLWGSGPEQATPVFVDGRGVDGPQIAFDAGVGRYLLTVAHRGGGRIGVFEAAEPWGAWRTVTYGDGWLGITGGEYLGIELPTRWMGDGGRTVWAVFSCYGRGACGRYHDRLNLMRATLRVAGR
jgi:hypothetical protein